MICLPVVLDDEVCTTLQVGFEVEADLIPEVSVFVGLEREIREVNVSDEARPRLLATLEPGVFDFLSEGMGVVCMLAAVHVDGFSERVLFGRLEVCILVLRIVPVSRPVE